MNPIPKEAYLHVNGTTGDATIVLLEREAPDSMIGRLQGCWQTNECDEYLFADLLFCPEVGCVYILDYYGFCSPLMPPHPSHPRTITRFDRPSFPKTVGQTNLLERARSALTALTHLKPIVYNKGHYRAHKKIMHTQIGSQVAVLHSYLPVLCQINICKRLKPKWMTMCLSRRQMARRWEGLEYILDRHDWKRILDTLVFGPAFTKVKLGPPLQTTVLSVPFFAR